VGSSVLPPSGAADAELLAPCDAASSFDFDVVVDEISAEHEEEEVAPAAGEATTAAVGAPTAASPSTTPTKAAASAPTGAKLTGAAAISSAAGCWAG